MSSNPLTKNRTRAMVTGGQLILGVLVVYTLGQWNAGRQDENGHGPEKPEAAGDAGTSTPADPADPVDPAVPMIEESILDSAEVGTAGHSRYIALDNPSGLWAIAGPPGMAPVPKAVFAIEGKPLPLSRVAVQLVLPAGLVAGSCLYAAVESKGPDLVSWSHSNTLRGRFKVEEGTVMAKAACVPDNFGKSGQDFFKLFLTRPSAEKTEMSGEPKVGLRGLWVVPQGQEPPAGPGRLETCATGRGWVITPGESLRFTAMAHPGSRLEMTALGKGAEDISARLAFDPNETKNLPMDTAGAEKAAAGEKLVIGAWKLPIEELRPVRVEVSLPASAAGPACLSRLELRRERPVPTVAGKAAEVEGVVVILIDTLRADKLRFISKSSPVKTPRLAALAAESVVFPSTRAQSHYTKPSVGTILTGVYPYEHNALLHKAPMLPSIPLLSERLRDAGVDTQAIVSNHFINNRKFGFQRGWNFMAHINSHPACISGKPVVDEVKKWAETWEPKGRFFVYIHLMDPHAPYAPPEAYELEYLGMRVTKGRFLPLQTAEFLRRMRSGDEAPPNTAELKVLKGLYNADVAHADFIAGQVIDQLEKKGILKKALLIVTSDHGEEFMEHGMTGHGTNLRKELIHVPLLMRWPGGALKGIVSSTVGHIDLAPAILDVFDIPKPFMLKFGASLIDLVKGGRPDWDRRAYLIEHKNCSEKGVVAGGWKLLVKSKGPVLAVVRGDVEEDLPLSDYPITWSYLRRRMVEQLSGEAGEKLSAPLEVELDAEEIEKLKAIGYIME